MGRGGGGRGGKSVPAVLLCRLIGGECEERCVSAGMVRRELYTDEARSVQECRH